MKNFTLELFCNIIGIGSASGLFFKNNDIYLVSDNAGYLYTYDVHSGFLRKTPVISSEILENIPKKVKPDFEALTEYKDLLYVFGSGSTPSRNILITANTTHINTSTAADLSLLYEKMRGVSGISVDDFNIEGALHTGADWLFFQRGNGGMGKNGIFTVTGELETANATVQFTEVVLPKIDHVTTTFTDALFVGGRIYFLATAEDTTSTYDDGEVVGSLIGILDQKTFMVSYSQQITSTHKFEGITFYQSKPGGISFLLCEDNDTHYQESAIYKLTIPASAGGN